MNVVSPQLNVPPEGLLLFLLVFGDARVLGVRRGVPCVGVPSRGRLEAAEGSRAMGRFEGPASLDAEAEDDPG
jgi:hypothetical protein